MRVIINCYREIFHSLIFLDFWATVCKTVRPMLSDRCLSLLSCLSVTLVYCGQTVGQIKVKLGSWHAGRSQPWPHCVRWGPSSASPKGAQPPIFGPYLLWPNGWMDQDATWYEGRPRPKRHCVTWGPSSPPPKRGQRPPNFRSMSVVGKQLHGSRYHLVWR